MVTIPRAWYNGSYTMAAKPIKSLELHYAMIRFSIKMDSTGDILLEVNQRRQAFNLEKSVVMGLVASCCINQKKLPLHCLISYRGGLGTSLCIMGYGTQHPHSQKEHIELYNILKFGVNQANIRKDTAIQKLQILLRNVWNAERDGRFVRRPIHFLVNFLSF